jgi:putative oxidoreductase
MEARTNRGERGVVLLARALLACVFVFSAVSKCLNFAGAVAEVQAMGLPMPAVVTVLVIIAQGLGSILLFHERSAPVGAAVLAVFTLAATVLAHDFWRQSGAAYSHELTTFLEHLGIIGGLILAGRPMREFRPTNRTPGAG